MARNKWMEMLAKHDGAVVERRNPFASVVRSPSPSLNFIFGNSHGLPRGYSMALYGPPKSGKCARFDTPIINPLDGSMITIEQFVKQKVSHVHSFDPNTRKITVREVSDWIDSGQKQIVSLKLKNGKKIKTTSEHPYFTIDGWKQVFELSVGDKIAIPRKLDTFGEVHYSTKRAFILGSLVADGGLTAGAPTWTKTDPGIREHMFSCVKDEFNLEAKINKEGENRNRIGVTFTNGAPGKPNHLMRWCREMGIDCLSKHKTLPDIVFTWDKQATSALLSGLFSGDGSVEERNIEYSSASEGLIDQIQHLLTRFGIVSYKKSRTTFYNTEDGERKEFPSHRLTIYGISQLETFNNEIQLVGGKALELQQVIDEAGDGDRGLHGVAFPSQMWDIIRDACASQGKTLTDIYRILHPDLKVGADGRLARHRFKTGGGVSIETLTQINAILNDRNLQSWIDSDVYFMEIVEIEQEGMAQCYDLTVPGTHSFVANDIVAHNSVISNSIIGQIHRDDPEALVLKFDTEFRDQGQLTDEHLAAFGVDLNRYMPYEVNTPDKIYDYIAKDVAEMCQAGAPIRAIIVDSVNQIQGRRAMNADTIMTQQIGDCALTNKEGLKMVLPVQRKYGISLILTTHVGAEMDPHEQRRGNKYRMASGYGVQHHAEYFIFVEPLNTSEGNKDFEGNELANENLTDLAGKAENTGHKIRVTMKDSSMGPRGRRGIFTIDRKKGIVNTEEEIFHLGVNREIVERPNNRKYVWNGREWDGKMAFYNALKESPDMCRQIIEELRRRDLAGHYKRQDDIDEVTNAEKIKE